DYVEAMWLMLQQEEPDDYVIATGVQWTIRQLAELAFGLVGLDWQDHVEVDKAYFRPAEVDDLRGDPGKARARLGWRPKITFPEMIREMLQYDLAAAGLKPESYLRSRSAKAS
ncbi:MAG: GDP-mannose 4,6-dehydratase, partial [Candidatus Dormibacteraeota bacterium]|nr:GDP-mannose 4,6-dehydratase [Candidatus Dormibacteraeota bacterium]